MIKIGINPKGNLLTKSSAIYHWTAECCLGPCASGGTEKNGCKRQTLRAEGLQAVQKQLYCYSLGSVKGWVSSRNNWKAPLKDGGTRQPLPQESSGRVHRRSFTKFQEIKQGSSDGTSSG